VEPLFRFATFVTLVAGLGGCGAARGTYFLVDAEQRLQDAREQGAPEAVYQWTMAEEHMKKAYEEWGYSDYEAAERMAGLAVSWAQKADEAVTSQKTPSPEPAPEAVPETTAQPVATATPIP
jgi:hypothetical protein